MTRILMTSLNYAPEETGIAPYSTKLAEHLAAQGYIVTVLTGMPHYPAWRVDPAYAGTTSITEQRNGVEVRRRVHYVPPTQSAARRARYEATSLMMALSGLRGAAPDAVIGVVPSLSGGVVARALAMRFRVPYGLVFQDLVGQAAAQSGVSGGSRVTGVVKAAEGWAARGAAGIGVIAEGFRPYLESLGVDATRVRRIRNWTHTSEPTIDRSTMRAQLGWPDNAIVCLHAGNMGFKQGLENLIDTATEAARFDAPLLFVLMGDGNQRAQLQRLAQQRELKNVRFLPLQAADLFPSVLAAADILLINQRGSVQDMSLPSKLTSYCAAGRPVVAAAAAGSETAHEISESSGGIVVPPDDPRAFLDGLLRVASDPGLAVHLARNAKTWAATALSEAGSLRSYEQLVASVLASGSHGRVHTPLRGQPHGPTTAATSEKDDRWAA